MTACWSCQAAVPLGEPVCGACGRIQPVDPREDCYALLGLPREFALDAAEVDGRHRERSRAVHPDRFARASPRERRFAQERATRLNDARRLLRDWRQRAAHLLRLAGQEPFGDPRAASDPDFLEEQLALREALEAARGAGDARGLEALARDAAARLGALERELAAGFADEGWYSDHAPRLARRLSRAPFLEKLAGEAGRAAALAGPQA